jgi:hypothetical protein
MTIRRIGWVLGAAFLAGLLAGVPDASAQDKVGTTGAQFLKIGVSPRAEAIGGAFTAIADDASAVFYNPAGLVQIENRQVMLSYIQYPADITHSFAALAVPLRFGGVLGVGYYGLDAGDMLLTDYKYPYGDGTTLGEGRTFGAKGYAVSVSYGRFLTDRFSVGGTFKLVDELLETERATGWAADIGTIYNTGFRNFKITMMISNFGPDMRHIAEDFPLPINFRFGGAVDILDAPKHHAVLAVEGSHPSDNRERYSAGLEYVFNNFASFRIGDRFEYDLGGISVGGGLTFKLAERYKARIDYAYQDFQALDKIQRFSLTVDF